MAAQWVADGKVQVWRKRINFAKVGSLEGSTEQPVYTPLEALLRIFLAADGYDVACPLTLPFRAGDVRGRRPTVDGLVSFVTVGVASSPGVVRAFRELLREPSPVKLLTELGESDGVAGARANDFS